MGDHFHLAHRYLWHHKGTTAILVGAITLILSLPSALIIIVNDATDHFRSRAASVPLIVGARASEMELVLGTLYFDDPAPGVIPVAELERIETLNLGRAIPLHSGVRTAETPVIGTSKDYFRLHSLALRSGRLAEIPGECVVGSAAARRLDLEPGDKLPVTSEKAFTLQDRPLRLHVTGVLAPTETPDDEVIFVDLKSIWIIQGLGHGHLEGAKHGSADATEYTDITKDNVASFHFHGRRKDFPLTAILVLPDDAKSRALLIGEYLSPDDPAQIVRPDEVMDGLMEKVFMVRSYVLALVVILSAVTFAVIALVFALSVRMRRRELLTMTRIGCSRFAITGMLTHQIAIILAISALLSVAILGAASAYGEAVMRALVL